MVRQVSVLRPRIVVAARNGGSGDEEVSWLGVDDRGSLPNRIPV
jgi:hypothetical protein